MSDLKKCDFCGTIGEAKTFHKLQAWIGGMASAFLKPELDKDLCEFCYKILSIHLANLGGDKQQ
jgi:hypothetical protein